MSAAAPLHLAQRAPAGEALAPVTLDDMADLRAAIVGSLEGLDELLEAHRPKDCTGEIPPEIEKAAAGIRLLLQLSASRVDGISALLRAQKGARTR